MRTVLSFQWGAPEHPQEDALLRDDAHNIFLVADGVTRTPATAEYPNPSPAKLASERLLPATHRALLVLPRVPEGFREACQAGNAAVRELNQELGLWNHSDYWGDDLAGAVFSGLLLNNTSFVWGFMTDCGVAHLSSRGEMLWTTEDRLTPVRQYFPKMSTTKERFVRVRQDFRNKPEAGLDRTFGTFTGEEAALAYLEVGERPFSAGETLLVFTDGMIPLIKNSEFCSLLCKGTAADIEQFVSSPEHCKHPDDKTILVVRV